ncbi:uncharacterized protein YjbI with pentapeptide repeats [Planomicrobium stackebrandtii]|uniref:Uncharacterized protein YjbI with pentapeptide repeats n=1 Tax=Planomicrobium stackebrandtii TaxID=253160 RepID=A0ABU0GYP9_9BACL|nr:pentapeptide repeat-containing protein [Planomicrobium stackebrandtii]MDQ0430475.1 uncharacterized protein YjbI with pentapeptide repeats [Planomicrobium stackebrandtii]
METNPGDAYDSTTFQADCANCFGLCCVALAFTASSDFPVDKAAGVPCKNLEDDFCCGIHRNLRLSGYSGCTVFDCLGAGQKVSQQTFGGISWKDRPQSAQQMFQVLPVMQQLHEMMLYLTQAIERHGKGELETELRKSRKAIYGLTLASAERLLAIDLHQYRVNINELLVQVSEEVRLKSGRFNKKMIRKKGPNYQGIDLMGATFQGKGMKGSLFRGTYLIGADLSRADLRNSDFIGADIRNADLSGADLSGSLYLTQMQLNSAKGNCSTKLPALLSRPAHWCKK